MISSRKVHLSIRERIEPINNNGKSKHLEGGGSRYACDQPSALLSRNVLHICAIDQTFKFECLKMVFSQNSWKRTFANWRFSAVLLYVALSCRFFRPWVMSSLNSLHWVMPSRRFRPGNFKFCKTSWLIWCVYHFDAISLDWCAANCLSCLLRASPWQWEPASTSRSLPQSSYQGIFFTNVLIWTNIYQNIRCQNTRMSEYPQKWSLEYSSSNKPQLCLPFLPLPFLLLRTQTLGTEFRVGWYSELIVQSWLFRIGWCSELVVQSWLMIRLQSSTIPGSPPRSRCLSVKWCHTGSPGGREGIRLSLFNLFIKSIVI